MTSIALEKDRRSYVQVLRKLAAANDVERVPDNSKKERVEQMVGQLREATLGNAGREKLEETWKLYRGSWPNWAHEGEQAEEVEEPLRWKFEAEEEERQ